MRQLIDSSGRLMGSSSGRDLKVIETGNRAFVTLKLRRDSMGLIGRMGEAALESRYLGGEKAPSRLVSTRMDVFKAVRLAKHINERYELERSRLSGCMFALKSVVSLSESGNLQGAMGLLGKVVNEMSAHSFYKILAKTKLESALSGLENASSAEGEFQKYRHLNPAISIVYAGIRRIGARCNELDGKSDYNLEREMYLRYLRDTYMRDTLSSLYSSLILGNKYAIANAYGSDFEIYNTLVGLMGKCEKKEAAPFLGSLVPIGQSAKKKKNKEHLLNLLRKAYARVKEGNWQGAYECVEMAAQFTAINKIFYFAEQLEKTGDPYTVELQNWLRDAHDGLISGNFGKAFTGIRQCVDRHNALFSGRLDRKVYKPKAI